MSFCHCFTSFDVNHLICHLLMNAYYMNFYSLGWMWNALFNVYRLFFGDEDAHSVQQLYVSNSLPMCNVFGPPFKPMIIFHHGMIVWTNSCSSRVLVLVILYCAPFLFFFKHSYGFIDEFIFLQVNWLPYWDYENIQVYIDDADVPLFRSNTTLISFWIVERHCPEKVMKQFGLQQIVPPHFQKPFPQNEMVLIGDNQREKIRSIYSSVWNKRMDAITYGEESDTSPHTDAYFQWYRGITQLRINRPTSGSGLNL